MKKFFADFKKFISKGNIIDLAVAVVVGGAFGKIVSSLVNDIIMPLIGGITGGKNVADWKWVIKEATETTKELSLNYGNFLQTIIDFLIISFFIFVIFRLITSSQHRIDKLIKNGKPVPAEEQKKETQEDILKDIRDLLQKKVETEAAEDISTIETSTKD